MKNNFIIGSVFVLITLFGSCPEVSANPAMYEPSNRPLRIQDLENATLSYADRPYDEFGIEFRGGTEAGTYANPHYFGYIANPFFPYMDGDIALEPTPLIARATQDDINPAFLEGDTVTIIYDGGQELTVYLPYMDGSRNWQNLFVATDGSTYFYYDADTDTLKGLAAPAPASEVVINRHPNEHANPRAFSGRFNYLNSQQEPSNEPLMIQDLENATLSYTDRPLDEFGIEFRGGTEAGMYANPHYFGEAVNPFIPYMDGDTALVPTPLIARATQDDINPAFLEGDTTTITYDGGQELTIYLPYMDGIYDWQNLFVATDGSTYYYYDASTDTLKGLAAAAP